MRQALAAVLLALGAAAPARAGALRHAAQAVLLVRENPAEEGRRAALGAAFDAAALTVDAEDGAPTLARGPHKNWFHRKPQALPPEGRRLEIPELPAAPAPAGLGARAAAALGAAFAPWRALAEAAWSGTWTGMVAVGLAEDSH